MTILIGAIGIIVVERLLKHKKVKQIYHHPNRDRFWNG